MIKLSTKNELLLKVAKKIYRDMTLVSAGKRRASGMAKYSAEETINMWWRCAERLGMSEDELWIKCDKEVGDF
jgi:hypothetical protein|tara:strand:- start:324 stop:542 length:219 start_codon:yes stop_codon:yes gene_type:complete